MSKISVASTSTDDQIIAQESKDVDLAASTAMTGADRAWMLLAHGGLLLVGVAGGLLLVWWALTFHQSNEQLWMVPVGLVLLGTPIFVWLSVFASAGVCRLPAAGAVERNVDGAAASCFGPGEMTNKENV